MPSEQPTCSRYRILPVTTGGYVLHDTLAPNGKSGLKRSKNVSELIELARALADLEGDEEIKGGCGVEK